MNRLYGVYDRADKNSLEFLYDGKSYKKQNVDDFIYIFESALRLIVKDLKNKRVYLDIKDRLLFIVAFLTLKKLEANVVLIPVEIQPEVFYEEGIVYITDNKQHPEAIFVNSEFEMKIGDDFHADRIRDFENRYDFYLFTSGSTGRSKLIGKSAGNIITEVMELYRLFKPAKKDIFYFTPPLYHIYGFLFGLMLPLYSSAVLDLEYHFSPESIAEYVRSHKVDYFISLPSYYRMFESLELIEAFKKNKYLFSSSAPLPGDISEKFYDKNVSITEIYGSTETGGIAHRVFAADPHWVLFSYVKIINEISDEAELTVDSPAISVEYERKEGFNTGDIVQFDDAGAFLLLGRNTRFVKIHGKRVDLGFVTAKFKEYAKAERGVEISDEVIYAGCKDEQIFIICEKEVEPDFHKLIDGLRKYLPGYGLPRAVLTMEIPRNEMGKINKVKIDEILHNL